MELDRTNMVWSDKISNEEILDKTFSLHYLLRTNQHIPFLALLHRYTNQAFRVTARFTYLGYNGHQLDCNGQHLLYRPKKRSDLVLGKDVTMGNCWLHADSGSSHQYPRVTCTKGNWCELTFISYGLPQLASGDGWRIHVLSLEPIEPLS